MHPYSTLVGIGHYLPKRIVSNDELSKTIDTSDDWIRTRTGIQQRHLADTQETTTYMAAQAANAALLAADHPASTIDAILVATMTPDKAMPSVACGVQHALQCKTAIITLDISGACSGFVQAVTVANALIRSHQANTILVIGAERMSSILDWQDRSTCVLFGDGAGAIVLKAGEQPGIVGCYLHTQGAFGHILTINERGHLAMDGGSVFKMAVTHSCAVIQEVLNKHELSVNALDWWIPHQANARIIQAVGKRLGIHEQRTIMTVNQHSNVSAASIPLAMAHAMANGKLRACQKVLLQAIGGGLSWGAVLLNMPSDITLNFFK
jgi:3-oxoacyl-[acyl-carrier-protein] synthase III